MLTDISIDSTLKTALAVVVADLSDVSTALLHHASPIAAATAATCSLSWRLNVRRLLEAPLQFAAVMLGMRLVSSSKNNVIIARERRNLLNVLAEC